MNRRLVTIISNLDFSSLSKITLLVKSLNHIYCLIKLLHINFYETNTKISQAIYLNSISQILSITYCIKNLTCAAAKEMQLLA